MDEVVLIVYYTTLREHTSALQISEVHDLKHSPRVTQLSDY